MPAGGLLIAGAVAAGTLIYGAIQKNKAKKAQAALLANRPQYEIPQSEQDIQNLAASRANQGMSANSRQTLQNNQDRALATASNAALMGGADANGIGNLVDKADQGYSQNAIYDDQIRLQNLNNLQQVWARNTANQEKKWAINTNQPWKDKMAANTGDLQYANGVINSGIGQLGSAAGGIGKMAFASRGAGGGNGMGGAAAAAGGGGGDMSGLRSSGGDGGWPSGPQSMGYDQNNSWLPKGPQTYQSGYSPTVNNDNNSFSYWGG